MDKIRILVGEESFWLLGVAAFACCMGIIVTVDWVINICWSIVAATIVYGVTVVLPRYSARKYNHALLLNRANILLNIGKYFFYNICSATDSNRIPTDKEIEEVCQNLDLSCRPSRMYCRSGEKAGWWNLLSDCEAIIETNAHEIINYNELSNIELSKTVDDLRIVFERVKSSFSIVLNMEDDKKVSNVSSVYENLKQLLILFRKIEKYVLMFEPHK